jgi:hypothetical protein
MRMTGVLVALAAGLAACGTAPAHQAHATGDLTAPAPGRFVARYGAPTRAFEPFHAELVRRRFLDTLAAGLTRSLAIPHDVVLAAAHCDEPNASYEPEFRRVTLCYELFEVLQARYAGEEDGEYLVTGTVVFALMHELGHALIDVLDLPVTGREEDAADQLATLLLLEQGPVGDTLLSGAAAWLHATSDVEALDELAFASDHGLGRQRVYNLICWIYGRDPGQYPMIRTDEWLPRSRLERCPGEYRRLRDSWHRLLAPHRRGPAGP